MDAWRTDYSDVRMVDPPEKVIPRISWVAQPARATEELVTPVSLVFCQYTGTGICVNSFQCAMGLNRLQRYYLQDRSNDDLPYNFVVGGNGFVYEGRGWHVRPNLPEKHKALADRSISIAFMGSKGEDGVTGEMMEARHELIKYGMEHNLITKKILQYFI